MTDLTAVGVHVFAGGFSLGIGPYFTVTDHLEGAATWERTVKHNLPTVRQWNPKTQWPVDRLRKDPPALLYANPPCAPFSSIGGRSFGRHWSVDPRLGCWGGVCRVGWAARGLSGRPPEYGEDPLPAVLPGEKLRSAIARLGLTPPAGGKVNFISAKLDPTTLGGGRHRASLL